MKLRHQLLTALLDGPLEVRELYIKYGRQIKPERAARMYDDNSRYSLEERISQGRITIITRTFADFKDLGWVEEIPHEKRLHRAFKLTELGTAQAAKRREEGASPFPIPATGVRRLTDDVVAEAAHVIDENLRILITDQWTEEEIIFQVSTDGMTQEAAIRSYKFYSRAKHDRPVDELAHFGKKLLFTRRMSAIRKTLDQKMEKGKRWTRLKPVQVEGEETYPKLLKIG